MADDVKQSPISLALYVLKRILDIILKLWREDSETSVDSKQMQVHQTEMLSQDSQAMPPEEDVAFPMAETQSNSSETDFAASRLDSVDSDSPHSLEPTEVIDDLSRETADEDLEVHVEINQVESVVPLSLDEQPFDESEGSHLEPTPETLPEEETGDLLTDWRTLAWQGDEEALQRGLNQALANYQAQVAELATKGDCLQVSVEGEDVPIQDEVVPILQGILQDLNLSRVTRLEIFGQKIGHELPFWMAQMDLDAPVWTSAPEGVELDTTSHLASAEAENPADQTSEQLLMDYAAGQRDFAKSDWGAVKLPKACLNLSNFQESHLVWANFQGAGLWHVNFSGAKLRHADLSGANLQGAMLNGADLRCANLRGANLSWAQLQGANLTDADLTDANLHQAQLDHVIMPDGTCLD